MKQFKKILFPCDLSENSARVYPYVASFAQKYGSKVMVLHVVEDLAKWGSGLFVPHPSLKTYQSEAMEGAERRLEEFCREELADCPDLDRKLLVGDPAQEILRVIEEEKVDLVIMGTHGRKGLEHTIFGSVAENVVKKSRVPVMVVNPHKVPQA